MWKVFRVIFNTILVFGLSVMVILYQRGVIVELGGETAATDKFYTMLIIGIIIALDVFNGAECVYLLYSGKNTDLLTGIPNSLWITRKGGMLSHFGKLEDKYTLVFVNIKECKYINEKIGNKNGDLLIRDFGQQLSKLVKKKGFVGRMGGDNFLAIIKNEYLEEYKNNLQNIYVDTTDKKGNAIKLHVNVRGGICRASKDIPYRDMINRTSAALAVSRKRNLCFVEYDAKMTEQMIKAKTITEAFKNSIMKGEFVPFYQPKVNLETGRLCGAEALSRWFRKGEMVSPGEFIPVLESEGYIKELDYYIFEQVCRQQKQWLEEGMEPVSVSINFSKLHLENPDFAEEIIAIKEKYNLDGRLLEIELTESSGCEDFNLLQVFAAKIKRAGFKISIDDFGTGYSSLSMLQKFEADAVKLDKSFLDSAFDEKVGDKHKSFLCDIIRMIRCQGEETVCEGVEHEEQIEFLKAANCDVIQGFYFDRPLPKEEFENRLRSRQYTSA